MMFPRKSKRIGLFATDKNTYYVLSHPKSGRTWLSVILDKILEQEYGIKNYDFFFKTGYFATSFLNYYKIRFTHGPSNKIVENPNQLLFKRQNVVFLIRDPKDVIVSYFYQRTLRKQKFDGSLSEFIRDPSTGISKIVKYLNIVEKYQSSCNAFLCIRYEDMHKDVNKEIKKFLDFMNLSISDEAIKRVTDWAAFNKMQSREKNELYKEVKKGLTAVDTANINSYKVRKGKIGGYKQELNNADQEFVDSYVRNNLSDYFHWYKG